MCKRIVKDEWSGVLFYSVTGSIKDPANFKIEIEDILPMDKGTSVYTSYDLDERFINYLMEDPKRMKYKVGHIHSHNVMNVFFSGTDMLELNDSAPAYNYYLSLIVNNYMEMTAKVAFTATASTTIKNVDYMSVDEAGKRYVMEQKDFTFEKEKLFVYDCGITVPSIDIVVDEEFAAGVAKILIPKPVKVYTTPVPAVAKVYPSLNKIPTRVYPPKKADKEVSISEKYKNFFDGVDFKSIDDLEDEEDEYEEMAQQLEIFAISLFSNSTQPLEDESLEDALLALVDMGVDPTDIARGALEKYAEKYVLQFPDNDDVDFVRDVYEVLDILYDVPSTLTDIINPTIKVVELMVKTFEEDARTV